MLDFEAREGLISFCVEFICFFCVLPYCYIFLLEMFEIHLHFASFFEIELRFTHTLACFSRKGEVFLCATPSFNFCR